MSYRSNGSGHKLQRPEKGPVELGRKVKVMRPRGRAGGKKCWNVPRSEGARLEQYCYCTHFIDEDTRAREVTHWRFPSYD